MDENGDVRFPIVDKVVKCLLALSEANGSVEHNFSQIAHVIRKDRNRLLPETECCNGHKEPYGK